MTSSLYTHKALQAAVKGFIAEHKGLKLEDWGVEAFDDHYPRLWIDTTDGERHFIAL